MENPSDNIFELGLLYQTIQSLKQLRESMSKHKTVVNDIDKTVKRLKTLLIAEIEKL